MEYESWPLGDHTLMLRFGNEVDGRINALVHQAALRLAEPPMRGVRAIMPSFAALALDLDLPELAAHGGESALLQGIAIRLAHPPRRAQGMASASIVEIPTRYGGADGPDLDEVAERLGMSAAQVIEYHCAPIYRVAQIGFQPGFPYLLGLPRQLVLPRRDQPRPRVAAGSVAMAGHQAGIYPRASPGGWQLLGRTELKLFDPGSASPCLLRPGDGVRFVAIA